MTTSEGNARSRATRWGAAALLAIAAIFIPSVAATANVTEGDSVYIGPREGNPGNGMFPIWLDEPHTGEPDFWAYCIENRVTAQDETTGVVGDPSDFLGVNYYTDPVAQGKVGWVLAHGYPAVTLDAFATASGVATISRNEAIEAVQYAVWRYTELDYDAAWSFSSAAVESAYWYLVNGANANAGVGPDTNLVTVDVTAPTAAQTGGTLIGPFVVSTNQPTVTVSVDPAYTLTDAAGVAIDVTAVVDGQELYLDRRTEPAAGSATVTATASGAHGTGMIISVPKTAGGTATPDSHAQSMVLVAASTATTSASANVMWTAEPGNLVPSIGTSLVDASDDDRSIAWDGGTVIDTIAYEDLTVGTQYTVSGELMVKSTGLGTGIVASTTFTPTSASGTVDVTFVIPEGYAGKTLVAFEYLFVGEAAEGTPVASHTDINDAAQTVTVRTAPVPTTTAPAATTPAAPAPSETALAMTGSSTPHFAGALALAGIISGAVAMIIARRRATA